MTRLFNRSGERVKDSLTIEMACDADYNILPEATRLRELFLVRGSMKKCEHEFLPSVSENSSACWYCGIEDIDLIFSMEWDTPVHECCIGKALTEDPEDKEAQIFAREFGLDLG